MTDVARVRVAWQNWPGAPGVSTFWADSVLAQGGVDALRTMFNSIAALIPTGLTIQVPNSGDLIDIDTGLITGTWSVANLPAVVTGTGAGAYAGNAGAVIHWLTNDIVTHTSPTTGKTTSRRLRGRTFIVPLINTAYDTQGSILASALTTLSNAAAGLLTAVPGVYNVWHRPKPGTGTHLSEITSSRVPDLAVSLRSRRV